MLRYQYKYGKIPVRKALNNIINLINKCIIGEKMKNPKLEQNITFRPIKSLYSIEGTNNSVNELYQRYIKDDEAIIEIDGLTYYKIIELYEFEASGTSAIVTIDSKFRFKIDDKLIDENGKTYIVKGIEMDRLSTLGLPEWYSKIITAVLDGNPYEMGDYLANLI